MDEKGEFAAEVLDGSVRGLAALVVSLARERESGNEARALIASEEAVADTELRLRQLAESAAAGIPELFAAHVEWLSASYAARGLPTTCLPTMVACLAEVLERELPRDAWIATRPHLDAGREALCRPLQASECLLDDRADRTRPHADLARRFLLALLEAHHDDALRLVETAQHDGTDVLQIHRYVLVASLAEIGRMWQAGDVHIGEERIATAIVADALALLRRNLPRAPVHAGRVLVASVEGNLHELGGRIVADVLELAGWTTFFLGANVPGNDLLQAAVDHHADLCAISVGMGVHVRATARLIKRAHALPQRRLPVVVGGQIFNRVPGLWRAVGADACATSAEEAPAVCARLIAR
ncbi:MAG: hypothetical protein EXS13_15280 [Planctomycetes bacterium]|nr:hypothetical protein [Planctomycetota bacterium]